MRALVETLLRGPNTLTPGERETIAAFVSSRNECRFCHASHRAAAAHHLGGDYAAVDEACQRPDSDAVSPKLRALLHLADKVRVSGREVTAGDVARAREAGASDREIHDAVLIAAAFCMFNRYVDGLATWTPEGDDAYDAMGRRMAHQGYIHPTETPA